MGDKLIARIEEGSLYFEGVEGDWIDDDGSLDLLREDFDRFVEPIADCEEAVAAAICASSDVWRVTIHNPGWVVDEGGWNLDYGYENTEIYLDWAGPVEVELIE